MHEEAHDVEVVQLLVFLWNIANRGPQEISTAGQGAEIEETGSGSGLKRVY